MQNTVRAEVDKAVDIDPLARIKAELPEFCTLVASARARARDGNDVDSVLESMRTLVALLLTVPEKDMLPTPNQRYGLDGFVYATHASAMAYALELSEHTKRVRQATKEFLEAEREMLQVRDRVRNEYASTLSSFETLVMNKETSEGVDLSTVLNDFLTGDISFSPSSNDKRAARAQPETDDDDEDDEGACDTIDEDSMSTTDESDHDVKKEEIEEVGGDKSDKLGDGTGAEAARAQPHVRLTVIEDSPLSLHSFFSQNNTSIISPNVDASTNDPFISVALGPAVAHGVSRGRPTLVRSDGARRVLGPRMSTMPPFEGNEITVETENK